MAKHILLAILIVCVCCASSDVPPVPTAYRSVDTRKGAQLLLVRPPAPAKTNILLSWRVPFTNATYRVYCTNRVCRPGANWVLLATIKSNSFKVSIDKKQRLMVYAVQAVKQ